MNKALTYYKLITGDVMKNLFSKYYWSQPIYKDDLKGVLLNGLIFSVLGGILAGALDFLFVRLGFPLMFGLIIICYLVGTRMRGGYYTYHILYPTLSILFMIIAFFFSEVTQMCLLYQDISILPSILSSGSFYLNFLFGPFMMLIDTIKSFNILDMVLDILNICIYFWAFAYCYRMVKGEN